MNIFVTGFHRAGSHTIAKYFAKKHDIPWVEEHTVELWGLNHIVALTKGFLFDKRTGEFVFTPALENGFVLQCPFSDHKVLDLRWYGKVYWADRNEIDLITSMKNGSFKEVAFFIIKQFHNEFPDDPYWGTTKFTDEEFIEKDFLLTSTEKFPRIENVTADNWIRYYKLVIDVKKHFLKTKFKDFVEVVRLEDLPVYNKKKHLSGKKPLKKRELELIKGM